MNNFLLAVLTLPHSFAGEAEQLEGLLEAGVDRLHLRKPEATALELEGLVQRLAPRWAGRLVVHGSREMAARYGVGQVHGAVEFSHGRGYSGGGPFVGPPGTVGGEPGVDPGGAGLAISTSVHSWEELAALPAGLAYAFISPLFDSISKRGYNANAALLQLPEQLLPCRAVGLGGIGAETIGEMLRMGWTGAAVLGWIWETPGVAVKRFEQLRKIVDEYN